MSAWEAASRDPPRQAAFQPAHRSEDAMLQTPLLSDETEEQLAVPEKPLAELNIRMQNEVMKLRQNNEQLTRMSGQLGTRDDNRALRKNITELIARTETLSSSINNQFRESALARKDAPRSVSVARNKLQRDFQREVAAFQKIVREVMDAQQRNRLRSSMSESGSLENSAIPQDRFKVQVHEDFDDMILEERDREIATIQHTMNTVNQIYKDLAVIMEEQKGDLEQVEAQIDVAHNRAGQGRKEITKASADQQKTKKIVSWLLGAVIVVGIIVIVILVGNVTEN